MSPLLRIAVAAGMAIGPPCIARIHLCAAQQADPRVAGLSLSDLRPGAQSGLETEPDARLQSAPPPSGVTVDSADNGRITLGNSRVRLKILRDSTGLTEEYYIWQGGWRLILRSGHPLRPDPSLRCDGSGRAVPFTRATIAQLPGGGKSINLTAEAEGHRVTRTISLRAEDSYFQTSVTDQVAGVHEISHLLSTYSFLPDGRQYNRYAPMDFVWTPQLRPDSADVIADHTFRSPSIMLQKGGFFAALIPDVDLIQPWRNIETAADLQVTASPSPMMSYGVMKWTTRSHVFYTHSDRMTAQLDNSSSAYGYFLWLGGDLPAREGYREIVRFQWERWGTHRLASGIGPQAEPCSVYVHRAWEEYLPSILVQRTWEGKPVTLLKQERLAWSNRLPPSSNNDCWFNVWFNALRTAYGAYEYSLATGNAPLRQKMEGVLNLALLAPKKGGIAPSIFYYDSAGGHWVNDHAWGGIDGGKNFAMFHNAWTSYWLLEWGDALPDRKEECRRAVKQFADFCLSRQRPSGVIPSWYDPETLQPVATFRDENAETAGAAYLLAELYLRTREEKYLYGAERAMRYICDSVVPRQKWFDFETFFSCSRKPVGFYDSVTQQYPQNTLSMHQAAEAFLALYRATNKEEYREKGTAVLDYLCLYQQVWSPPWLSRQLFGGFGVQNTDGEWSDARQGYFAVTLMKYYDLTGKREYFERSVAAVRAMFSLLEPPPSPRTAENYAHSALDRPGGVTGIHWGTGSSVVSFQMIRSRFGDAYVDMAGGWGCGIDGCRVSNVRVEGSGVNCTVRDDVKHPRAVRLTFGHCPPGSFTLTVNGVALGTFSSKEMETGVTVSI